MKIRQLDITAIRHNGKRKVLSVLKCTAITSLFYNAYTG